MSDQENSEFLNYKLYQPENLGAQQHTPLIILHGLLGSMDNWRSQAKHLSIKRPVITMDLRNHGNSPHLAGMSYREMYQDVIQLAEHLGLGKFDLLGHSMGGKVAMQLALNENQNASQTTWTNKLIIVDIAPRPYPLWHQQTLQAVMDTPVDSMNSRQEIDEYLKDKIEDLAERNFMIKNLRRANADDASQQGFRWKCNLDEISRGYLKIAGFNTAHQSYNNKTLFIRGENSPYINEHDYSLIQTLFTHSNIITIKNSGHLPHFQQAKEFFTHVDTFLSATE